MERVSVQPRSDWKSRVESQGFLFHSLDDVYWDETTAYKFDIQEILKIEKATDELYRISLEAVQHVIDNKLYAKFSIPDYAIDMIERSWDEEHPAIYSRMDLCYRDGEIKMLEYNADTPTSLLEAAVIQWMWLQDQGLFDQFNSIHEKLVEYWRYLKPYLYSSPLYLSSVKDSMEDIITVDYMTETAKQGGLVTKFVYIEDIGRSDTDFTDLEDNRIKNIFKLYPWEWLIKEEFGKFIVADYAKQIGAYWIEPPWRMILSNKAILPILWELNPRHQNLLPAYFDRSLLGSSYVKKPILGREGANIEIIKDGSVLIKSDGNYDDDSYIYQELFEPPDFDGKYPVLGSWVIGGAPAGMGIRESDSVVTGNTSRFVPHFIHEYDKLKTI